MHASTHTHTHTYARAHTGTHTHCAFAQEKTSARDYTVKIRTPSLRAALKVHGTRTHTHTRTRTCTRAHAHAHTHTRTQIEELHLFCEKWGTVADINLAWHDHGLIAIRLKQGACGPRQGAAPWQGMLTAG